MNDSWKMIKYNNRCTLCLTLNKRTLNIFRTNLQYVYENLANLKVISETWMCFICHERLRQCYLLQQLAINTRGLIAQICEIDTKFESLLELSTSDTKIVCLAPPCKTQYYAAAIKTEPDETSGFHLNESEIKEDKNVETTNDYEDGEQNPGSSCADSEKKHLICDDDTLKVDRNNSRQTKKELFLIIEKLSPSIIAKFVRSSPEKGSDEHFEEGEFTSTSTKKIKQEVEEVVADTGFGRDDEQENSNDCEGQEHMDEASPDCYKQPYSSDVLLNKFGQKVNLKQNFAILPEDKPYRCVICLNKYKLRRSLRKHIKIHTEDKPYGCDVCLKKFSEKYQLRNHIRIHTGDKPYSCHVCLKRFNQKSYLKQHIESHNGGKPYSCDVCLKKFRLKHQLENHIRIHTGDKPYSCHVCLKKFNQKSKLKEHIKSHNGGKPYSCDVCLKKFKHKYSLKLHTRTHTGDKSYDCDVCLKKFYRKSNLESHIIIHTGDKPYGCHVCLKKF
ncbi:zinc finger protein 39-like isoform X2 [Aricia agestis]|uniref:zinc finger protein 39-like isoform X2 n=1 Tax=Aricia agestis TaxID=91739 RepID=UPI001C202958|nr:zinc finger protein 39-like isoform X2 [Aricia agestis]